MTDSLIHYVATAKGTWPYYFRATSLTEAEKFVHVKLNKEGEFDYEWTIEIDSRPEKVIDDIS